METVNLEVLPEKWQKKWQAEGFSELTAIQKASFTALKQQKNVIGIAPTGSGKTLAYLLPLLLNVEKGAGNQLLILLPSQELAVQVNRIAKEWGNEIGLNVQGLIGGANVQRQKEKLREKPEVLVGTSGRVVELVRTKKIKAHQLKTIVLDEVDQLLQDSDVQMTQEALKTVKKESQKVFFSATVKELPESIKENLETEPILIDVRADDQSTKNIHHHYLQVSARRRADLLKKLTFVPDFRGLVFFNQLSDLGDVASKLLYEGIPVATLASDQSKMERKLALHSFAEGKVSLLLTTDIASRGLDFVALPYVIHYDIPYTAEAYLHRSGRTGRMGKAGEVISFVDAHSFRDLKQAIKKNELEVNELFLYGSELVTERPHDEKKEIETNPQAKPKIKGTNFPTTEMPKKKKIRPEKIATTEIYKKKKKRKKDQKNKGARKKKSES